MDLASRSPIRGEKKIECIVDHLVIQDCSVEFAKLFKTSVQYLMGKSILDISPSFQRDGSASTDLINLRMGAAQAGLPQSFEWSFKQEDSLIDVLITLEKGGDKKFCLRLRPLNQSEVARDSVRDSKILLQQMLDNSTAVVYVIDKQGGFQFVNHYFLETFNLKETEVIGRNVYDMFPKDLVDSFMEANQKVFEHKRPIEVEEKGIIDGELHTYLSIKFPLFNNENDVYAVCGISTDITVRKKSEDAFRQVALGVSGASDDDIFKAIVTYLVKTLDSDVDFAFVGSLKEDGVLVDTLAVYDRGNILENITYDLENTPCEHVVGKDYYFLKDHADKLYPQDGMLSELKLVAYAGFPLTSSKGEPLGLLSIGSRKPLREHNSIRSVLEIFSVRAAAELERLAADRAKHVSDESYRSIFAATEDAIVVLDLEEFHILDANPKARHCFALPDADLMGLNFLELAKNLMHQDYDLINRSMSLAKHGEAQHIEWQRLNKDGAICWDNVFIKRATIAGSERILVISQDITEKKIAESLLKSSEEQYRLIFDVSVDGIIVFDLHGNIIDANPMFKIMHGYDADHDFSEVLPQDIIPPESIQQYQEYISTVTNIGKSHIIGKGVRRDGKTMTLDIHGIRMSHFGKTQLLTIVRDITAQQNAEEALRKSEDRLRATFEAALDAIVSMDEQGNIIEFNPAAEACFLYRREQAIGKKLAELIIPQRFRQSHIKGMQKFMQSGKGSVIGKRIEVTAMRSDGSEFPAELAIDVNQGSEGKIFIGYMRDITERINAEESRNKLEAQLRQAQKMEAIGHLTGGIAHDFNNILTSIMGYIVLAEERLANIPDEKMQKYLSRASRSGQKARNLIQQMLTFSRGQRGEPRALSIGPLIKESIKLLEASLPSSVEIEYEMAANVSQVMLDPVHLEQILMNLCINARDAVKGNGNINVTLKQQACVECMCDSCKQSFSGDYVELVVQDDGIGINAETLERMFEPFYTTKEVGKGSGMGLSTVHGIVHEYGGHIHVDSEEKKGTRIHVLLKSLQQSATEELNLEEQNNKDGKQDLLHGRVLVVDDEESVSEFMMDLLETWGLDVAVANNGPEALKLFSSNSDFDLVITDFTMPKMTGIELAGEIRRHSQDIPIILYTGYSQDLQEKHLESVGISAFLPKPLEVDVAYEQIKQLISK